MTHQLNFDHLLNYDTRQIGIGVEVTLSFGAQSVSFVAKIDTGASYCIFERARGEALGLDIESGTRESFSTATGSFIAYGHTVTLATAGFEFDSFVFFAVDDGFNRNVLGRFGWLDHVVLGLVDYEGKLYLSRYLGE